MPKLTGLCSYPWHGGPSEGSLKVTEHWPTARGYSHTLTHTQLHITWCSGHIQRLSQAASTLTLGIHTNRISMSSHMCACVCVFASRDRDKRAWRAATNHRVGKGGNEMEECLLSSPHVTAKRAQKRASARVRERKEQGVKSVVKELRLLNDSTKGAHELAMERSGK